MKIEINSSEHALEIMMSPENMKELNELYLYAQNARAEKPRIYMKFYNDGSTKLYLTLRKISEEKQKTDINNY